jgi:hypothetical protein
MSTLTARQMDIGRRQLEIEDALIAQGMAPGEAARVAAARVMQAGNGAELDNLEAAAAPLSVEPMVGVDPESLPADEYGAVSGRTVREANRPMGDAERALAQEQGLAREITDGYRSGQRNWQAEGDYQYAQDQGLGGFEQGAGKTDLDYRRRLQEQQGFIRTPQGMIPAGPQITPERVESLRDFTDWANETPGTARQAVYDPEGYEQFREGVRDDIRNRAQWEEMTFGAGPDRAVSPLQRQNRAARKLSEDRVRDAQRGDFYKDRLMVDQGVVPPAPGPDATVEELERAAFRDRYARRQAELEGRQQSLIRTRQAQTNPLEYMNRSDISNWNRFAAAQSVLGGRVRGATPNDVAAARNEQLTALGLRVAQGQGFQQSPPGQEELIRQKLNEGKPVQVRAQEAVASGRLNDPTILQYADDLVHSNYSSRPGMLGVSTYFTDNEVRLAAQRLAADTGLKLPEAEQVLRRIQEDRNRGANASNIASFFYDQ